MSGISAASAWSHVEPNRHGDWVKPRDDSFDKFLPLGTKAGSANEIFKNYSAGMKTNRDAWAYNSSRSELSANIERSIDYFNSVTGARPVQLDEARFKWCQKTLADAEAGARYEFDEAKLVLSTYRPFTKRWLYRDAKLNWSGYLSHKFYPNQAAQNRTIVVKQNWSGEGQLVLQTDNIMEVQSDGGTQCFPLWLYESSVPSAGLFEGAEGRSDGRVEAITEESLRRLREGLNDTGLSEADVFDYIYGLLHSPDYQARYVDNLRRQLPRVPILKRAEDFWAFVEAGRRLGDLHVNYETVEPYPVAIGEGDLRLANIDDPVAYFRVGKMKFAGKRPKLDKTTVIYNPRITITNIPLAAYEYVVNGKSALEWVIERQCVSNDPASGIVNDANAYANETVGDPRYPFDLFCRIITVSLETMKIVNALPALDIRDTVGEPAA